MAASPTNLRPFGSGFAGLREHCGTNDSNVITHLIFKGPNLPAGVILGADSAFFLQRSMVRLTPEIMPGSCPHFAQAKMRLRMSDRTIDATHII
jgi:hypothetical protein